MGGFSGSFGLPPEFGNRVYVCSGPHYVGFQKPRLLLKKPQCLVSVSPLIKRDIAFSFPLKFANRCTEVYRSVLKCTDFRERGDFIFEGG